MEFRSYDTTEEMFADIERNVQAAIMRTEPRQWRITYGEHFMRSWGDLLIFGRVIPRDELNSEEVRLGATPEELEYENRVLDEQYSRGFRFSRCYSIVEPRGELGDTHVSTMVPLTEREFIEAQSLNWMPELIVPLPWFRPAVQRLDEE